MPREGRMALARNVGLRELRKLPKTDFVIMVDMDILGWDLAAVVRSFSVEDWDVMCANGIVLHGVFRDTYAFRQVGLDTNHHWAGGDYKDYNLTLEKVRELRKQLNVRGFFCLLYIPRRAPYHARLHCLVD